MSRGNKVFLIRGFKLGTTAADEDFSVVRDAIAGQGFEVVPVDFPWNFTTISQYTAKFTDFYSKRKGKQNIVLGHSFGAMVALLSAGTLQPNVAVLASLSGYFKEDIPGYDNTDWIMKHAGKRRVDDMHTLSAKYTAKQVADTTRFIMLYGEKEKGLFPVLYNRVQQTAKDVGAEELIAIKGADHSIRGEEYLEAIRTVFSGLR